MKQNVKLVCHRENLSIGVKDCDWERPKIQTSNVTWPYAKIRSDCLLVSWDEFPSAQNNNVLIATVAKHNSLLGYNRLVLGRCPNNRRIY